MRRAAVLAALAVLAACAPPASAPSATPTPAAPTPAATLDADARRWVDEALAADPDVATVEELTLAVLRARDS